MSEYADLQQVQLVRLQSATDIVHDFANKPIGSTVDTESGAIPSLPSLVQGFINAASGRAGYATKADLDADLQPGPGYIAEVTNDPTYELNQQYVKMGEPGLGGWVTTVDRLQRALGSAIGYIPTGAGTLARSFANRLQEERSILDWTGGKMVDDFAPIIRMADAWCIENGGGRITFPAGNFFIRSDTRILSNCTQWVGQGTSSNILGVDGARLMIGEAILVSNGPGNEPEKTGTKCIQVTLSNLGIKPLDNHAGECLTLDYCDYTVLHRLDVGPYNNDGSTVTHGVRMNWVQYTEMDQVFINVNGACVWIELPYAHPENEDHYSFHTCWFYNGKSFNTSFSPCIVYYNHATGRSAGIFHTEFQATHFMRAETNANGMFTRGIMLANQEPAGQTIRTFQVLDLHGCFFENVDYPYDSKTLSSAYDSSLISLDATSMLVFKTALLGKEISKSSANVKGCYFQEGELGFDGIRCFFEGANRALSVTKLFGQSANLHRFSDKSGLSLSGAENVRLRNAGTAAGAIASSTLVINHGLIGRPDIFNISPTWPTTWWLSNVGATSFQINFGTPPNSSTTVYWLAELSEA